ncbi:hypothetical protein [Streptomyces sp. NBC_01439]|uniref:hypothetical protein n=1 Tax=Streptomyces sp. NBC_01439 TaxID=2903867 RepID=UPI0032487E01
MLGPQFEVAPQLGMVAAGGDLEQLRERDEFTDPAVGGVEDVSELLPDPCGRAWCGQAVGVEEPLVVAAGNGAAG